MASQQIIGVASSSSSSSSLVSSKKYDVFLSFHSKDTRRNFTSHLYDALDRKKVITFIDNELQKGPSLTKAQKGDDISPKESYDALVQKKVITFIDDNELQKGDSISPRLTKAIEESYISIVIFSENYASSKWCLNELIKILECKNDWGQIVIPVFYNIDPSHIRKQTGSYKRAFAKQEGDMKLNKDILQKWKDVHIRKQTGSYERAFAKHEGDMKLNKDILQKWKDALFEASNLVGFDSSKYKNDAVLFKDIVEDVLRKLKPRHPSSKKNDVFLNFRGEDTRRNFTSHLYLALIGKNLKTFIDDNELQKGDDISPSLTKAIEESYISIVIFSKHYASSKWCLNELIKILECKNSWGQIVIPVFYYIDPSHVRHQTDSYQEAFAKHEGDMKLNKDILQKWKYALFEASNLVGFDTSKYKNDAVLFKDIVEDVLRKLNPLKIKEMGLVGIERRCEEMISLLEMGSNDVRSIGVWGIGGIGKTTLVEVLFAELFSQFEGCCFLNNVREESHRYGLDAVINRLFSTLLEEENIRPQLIKKRLEGKKLLIVLDDVETSNQMECLTQYNNVFGKGSRVIITTRNKHIIKHVHAIYKVNELNDCESLELFCLKAFGKKHPKIGYEELSNSAISFCKGNSLALKVLGARLSSKSKKGKIEWESDLEKLQKMHEEIHNV